MVKDFHRNAGIFIALCSVSVLATNIRNEKEDIKYVKEGTNVELQCKIRDVDSWQNFKSKAIIAICRSNGSNEVNSNISTKVNVTSHCSLVIHNVSPQEAIEYQCYGRSNNHRIHLQLIKPPYNMRIEESNAHHEVFGVVGQNTTITCHVNSGVPKETITWTKNNKPIISGGPSVLKYTFSATSYDDMMQMVCSANNTIDDVPITQEIIFRILNKPIVLVHATPNMITEGQSVTLKCNEQSGVMVDRIYWKHNGRCLSHQSNPLIILSVESSHGGEYTCVAINRAGESNSTVNLSVMYSPRLMDTKTTFSGHSLERKIVCRPDGIPDTYTFGQWTHTSANGDIIRYLNGSQNGTVILPPDSSDDPRYQDSGIYICNVSNNVTDRDGNIWRTGRIVVTIQGKPALAHPRKALVQFGVFNSNSNISIDILSSTQILKVTWVDDKWNILKMTNSCSSEMILSTFFQHEVYVFGYQCSLTIENTQPEHFQRYTVTVENEVGNNTFGVSLRSARPPVKPKIKTLKSGTRDISISLLPSFDGGYRQGYVIEYRKRLEDLWKNMTTSEEIQILNIYDLEPDTEYEVKMFAFNKIGRSDVTNVHVIKTKDEDTDLQVVYGLLGILATILVLVFPLRRIKMYLKEAKKRKSGNIVLGTSVEQEVQGYAIENDLYNTAADIANTNSVHSAMVRRNSVLDVNRVIYRVSLTEHSNTSYGQHNIENERTNRQNDILNYVQIVFEPVPSDRKFYIRGTESRTPYAEIDFATKVDISSMHESSSSDKESDDDDFMYTESIKHLRKFSE